jgi:holo-[acyl-carrier protein] synthase
LITGIGVDMVEIARVVQGLAAHGENFARRILAESEWAGFRAASVPAAFLAKRFAAKEAFGKALGTGVRAPATLRAMWVEHDALGRPGFGFDAALAQWLDARGVARHHLSLTDERDAAIAFVILEGKA